MIAARTARTLQPGELAWQIDYVVRLLDIKWQSRQ